MLVAAGEAWIAVKMCVLPHVRADMGSGEEASHLRAQCQIAEACDWIKPFGERGRRLDALAQFVLERDH